MWTRRWSSSRRATPSRARSRPATATAASGTAGGPTPTATQAKPADFSGLWLTDLGLMELTGEGSKVKGRYAFRGTSSLEGEVKGRHLDFQVKAFRTGPGWFDLDEQGKTLAGAGGTDGMPGWYGWKGRKAPEFVRHAPLAAGKIVDGSTERPADLLRPRPRGLQAGRRQEMAGGAHPPRLEHERQGLREHARGRLARHRPRLHPPGHQWRDPLEPRRDEPAFNYTYVNYVGRSTFGGFPGTDRESPALVREAIDELKSVYPIKHYFVGGHSQGGFLTYSLLMNSPEAIAGAFPISAGVIFQCEPSAYADPALKAAQRAVPLAIVHGKNDPMVPFEGGSYAYGLFLDAGWPAVRLFDDDTAAHMFARLPVGPAIRWLEVMTSDDPSALLDFAEQAAQGTWLPRCDRRGPPAQGLALDAQAKARLEGLLTAIDAAAAPKARTYLEAIRAGKDNSWVDGFLAFRDEFEFADASADAMAAFNDLRARHEQPAAKLMGEARGLFQQGRRDDGFAKAKEVVDKYYAVALVPPGQEVAGRAEVIPPDRSLVIDERGHRGLHLAVEAAGEFRVENRTVVPARDDLDHGIALQPGQ